MYHFLCQCWQNIINKALKYVFLWSIVFCLEFCWCLCCWNCYHSMLFYVVNKTSFPYLYWVIIVGLLVHFFPYAFYTSTALFVPNKRYFQIMLFFLLSLLLSSGCLFNGSFNRNQLKDKLLVTPEDSGVSTTLLLESVVLLIDPKLPWVCKIVGYLLQRNAFTLLRDLVLMMKVFIYFHQMPTSSISTNTN